MRIKTTPKHNRPRMTTNPDFSTKGPITQQRAERATEWIAANAVAMAEAKGARDKAEHMIKVQKSLAMSASGQNSVSAQEREALSSERYLNALDEYHDANVRYETLYATRFAATTLIDVWRSINAAMKGARV